MQSNGADDWEFIWQNLSEGMARNPARDFRFNRILKKIPDVADMKILDFGCGTGNLLSALVNEFPKNLYFGVDISSEAIRATKSLCPTVETGFIDLSSGTPVVRWPNNYFDVVICTEVLEHSRRY